jgi:DNA-binding transcriptional LysR family regulator
LSCGSFLHQWTIAEIKIRKYRMPMKLESLRTLVAIVEGGSLAAAARQLRLSNSVVSDRLTDLERELGARLIQRTSRSIALTAEGRRFYASAGRILQELDEATAAVAQQAGELAGPLHLSVPMTFSQLYLGTAICAFVKQHPRIELKADLDDHVTDIVGRGFDMAVRIGRLPDSSLVARRICVSRRLVVMSPDYATRNGLPGSLRELSPHAAITYTNVPAHDEWQFTAADGVRAVRLKSVVQVNNGSAQCEAAEAGVGIAILPTFIAAEPLVAGRLVAAPIPEPPVPDTIYAVYPQNRHVSSKVRALTDHLRASFADPPPWDRRLAASTAGAT